MGTILILGTILALIVWGWKCFVESEDKRFREGIIQMADLQLDWDNHVRYGQAYRDWRRKNMGVPAYKYKHEEVKESE